MRHASEEDAYFAFREPLADPVGDRVCVALCVADRVCVAVRVAEPTGVGVAVAVGVTHELPPTRHRSE